MLRALLYLAKITGDDTLREAVEEKPLTMAVSGYLTLATVVVIVGVVMAKML